MSVSVTIRPTQVFDRRALEEALDLKASTLGREVRLGRLQERRRGNRRYYLGRDVLAWLDAGEVPVNENGSRD